MRTALRIVLALLLLVAAFLAAWWVWILRRDERLRETWKQEIFDGVEPAERFPARQPNRTALEIERLAAGLGLDFSTGAREAVVPTEAAAARWERVAPLLKEHTWVLRANTLDQPPVASAELEAFVVEHGGSLARVRDLLVTAPPPSWELHLERGVEAPLPNYIAQLQLHRLLGVSAHRKLDVDDEAAAAIYLEAAWRLGRDPAENPLMIARLIRLSEIGDEIVAFRRFCSPPSSWHSRLESLDPRPGILRALQIEGWAVHAVELPLGEGGSLSRSWQRMMFVPLGETVQHSVERLRTEDPLTLDFEHFTEEEQRQIPRWAPFSRSLYPNLFDAWSKALRAELAAEHALLVLEARRRLAGGETIAGSRRPSTAVPGLFWLTEATETGVRIALDGGLDDQPKHSVSLDLTIARAGCGEETALRASS